MKIPWLIFCLALTVVLFAGTSPAAAFDLTLDPTDGPGGGLESYGTWYPSTGYFYLTDDLTIASGDNLTIASGVYFCSMVNITNNGYIYNNGHISNDGTFSSVSSGRIYNNGYISNGGTFYSSLIYNNGYIKNSGCFYNGNSYNYGEIANVGYFENCGIIYNYGSIGNGGGFDNEGGIINYIPCGSNSGVHINGNPVISVQNNAPELSAIGDQEVDEGALLSITLSATDLDLPPQPLTYSTSATFGTLIGNEFTWTPGYDDVGSYVVEFNVSDGCEVVSETITVTVKNVTDPEDIPEFSTIALPVASILALLFLFNHRKRRKED